jgi:hypothetical protein
VLEAVRHDAEADVAAGRTLTVRPGDEALESFHRRRRRRNEARDFFSAQHFEQRGRVRQTQLPQGHGASLQNGQGLAPVGRFHGRP